MKIEFKDFNLGAELEGSFSQDLFEMIDNKRAGMFRGDGSVEWGKLTSEMDKPYVDYSEFNTKVVNWEGLKKILMMFKKPDYNTNESCGLHIHISCKKIKPHLLNFLVADIEFLQGLKKMAMERFGDEQVKRLGRKQLAERYYGDYKNGEDLDYGISSGSKYQFVRFHPNYHTLEFRFLYPYCDDPQKNINNVELLLSALCERLNSRQSWSYPVEVLQEKKREYCKKINIDIPIIKIGNTDSVINLSI